MFNSLKRQNRVRVPGQRRTMSAKPVSSGRGESTIASSDEGDLKAISNAMRFGRPIYFVRSGIGTTLDVCLEANHAIRVRDEMRGRIINGRQDIQAYVRHSTPLIRLA